MLIIKITCTNIAIHSKTPGNSVAWRKQVNSKSWDYIIIQLDGKGNMLNVSKSKRNFGTDILECKERKNNIVYSIFSSTFNEEHCKLDDIV